MTPWMLSLALLAAVTGAMPGDVRQWEHSPEAYFMTQDERIEWAGVTSEDAARAFIEAFRARHARDFSAEVQRRAQIVDERMPLGDTPASMTLRGKVIILLGAPAELTARYIPRTVAGNVGHPLETRKGGANDTKYKPTLINGVGGWVEYTMHYGPNPALGIGPEGFTVVIEADSGYGKDRLKYARRDKKKLDEVLEAAARSDLRSH